MVYFFPRRQKKNAKQVARLQEEELQIFLNSGKVFLF